MCADNSMFRFTLLSALLEFSGEEILIIFGELFSVYVVLISGVWHQSSNWTDPQVNGVSEICCVLPLVKAVNSYKSVKATFQCWSESQIDMLTVLTHSTTTNNNNTFTFYRCHSLCYRLF